MGRARSKIPARYPAFGVWPAQMRADMVAAYLDYPDTAELADAVGRGEAPPPSALRGAGRTRQPVWNRDMIDRHLGRHLPADSYPIDGKEDLQSLV